MTPIEVICRLPGDAAALMRFTAPARIIVAAAAAEVEPALAAAEKAARDGNFVAGMVAYEAAPAFDPAFKVRPAGNFPLVWFAVFPNPPQPFVPAAPTVAEQHPHRTTALLPPPLHSDTERTAYHRRIATILAHIAAGDIYQVNYTIRVRGRGETPATAALFAELYRCHPVPEAAFIDTGTFRLLSLSPELFLERQGRMVRSVPMKGTAPRELDATADLAAAAALADDEKNRAENLMIVDMVRNDLGRVCDPGSIVADPLFQVETFRTVHQMTGTVRGRLRAAVTLPELFAATFPAASITGAPKVRAMEIIHAVEPTPRRAYTGTVGCLIPGGDCRFNVAIRTLTEQQGKYELGVGGGIVADSQPEAEWAEARLKSAFAAVPPLPPFQVLETMLYRRRGGWSMREEHLARLARSQRYFGRPFDRAAVIAHLDGLTIAADCARVRLTLDRNGRPATTVVPLTQPGWSRPRLIVGLAATGLSRREVFLYHKTTRRDWYDHIHRRGLDAGCDDIICYNTAGELTESCIANLFIHRRGVWLTPALKCGLLPGLWRQRTMTELDAREAVLTADDLAAAETILLGNSVRGGAEVERLVR
ncbi:MAG: aminodeoxychorismate synthase component I [Victivallales bacterium]|nr:aminodeoxychorismate synthase component I [Victivallales bacterium]